MFEQDLLISSVFVAGLLSFFAPCILPLLPVYVGHFSTDLAGESHNGRKWGPLTINPLLLGKTLIFVLGLSTTFVLLGFGAGALGQVINQKWFYTAIGALVIVLGIHQTGLVHWRFLERDLKWQPKARSGHGWFATYLLGLTFSFGWTPCIGPILAAVLGLTATKGQAIYGGFMMLIYALGLMVPFLLMALFSGSLLDKMKFIKPHMGKIQVVGGILIILMGFLLVTNQLTKISVFFENLL